VKDFRGETTHVLSFINLKGGVGKTTTAVAVAELLAQEQRKHVLLVDLDPQTKPLLLWVSESAGAEIEPGDSIIKVDTRTRLSHAQCRIWRLAAIELSAKAVQPSPGHVHLRPLRFRNQATVALVLWVKIHQKQSFPLSLPTARRQQPPWLSFRRHPSG